MSKMLESYGAKIIDADKLGHEAYNVGTDCFTKLVAHFGPEIVGPDQQINRKALGAIVFSETSKMRELESIVWPEIKILIRKYVDKHIAESGDNCVVAVEAAIMIEAQWTDLFDTVWVVTVNPDLAIGRMQRRNNITKEEAMKRLKSQISNEERVKYANVVVKNEADEGAEDQFKESIERLMLSDEKLKSLVHATKSKVVS